MGLSCLASTSNCDLIEVFGYAAVKTQRTIKSTAASSARLSVSIKKYLTEEKWTKPKYNPIFQWQLWAVFIF